MKDQSGQVLIVLVLITLVALTVGLAITQRTVSDISNSTKTEQSTRAISAAEAGIEQAVAQEVQGNAVSSIPSTSLNNQSSYQVTPQFLPQPTQALEYPKIGKADFAHFWLANPADPTLPAFFNKSKITVYFGNSPSDPTYDFNDTPAIELNIVTLKTTGGTTAYISNPYYLDSKNRNNGFTYSSSNCDLSAGKSVVTSFSNGTTPRTFLCGVELNIASIGRPILARVRVLYSNKSQSVAIGPPVSIARSSCNNISGYPNYTDCDLPPQVSLYSSTGVAGVTRRKLQLFRQKYVVPFYFDYAIFSTFDVAKN